MLRFACCERSLSWNSFVVVYSFYVFILMVFKVLKQLQTCGKFAHIINTLRTFILEPLESKLLTRRPSS